MEVTYENKPEDIAAILSGIPWTDRLRDYGRTLQMLLSVWPLAALYVVLSEWFILACLLGVLAVGTFLLTILFWRIYARVTKHGKVIPGVQKLRLTEDYLEVSGERGISRRVWSKIRMVQNQKDHVAIYVQKVRAYVVPKRYFASPEEADAFAAHAQDLVAGAAELSPTPIDWEAFRRDAQLDQFQLLEHLTWNPDPKLYARLQTMGADTQGKNAVPTARGLLLQLILPGLLTVLLFVLRYEVELVFDGFYYVLLVVTSLLLFSFGLQWHSRARYLSELSAQAQVNRPGEVWLYDQGVATRTAEGMGFSRWSILDQIVDDREAIVVYDTIPHIFLVIPKSVLSGPEKQAVLFEQLKDCFDIAHNRAEDVVLAEVTDNPFQSPSS